MQNDKKDGERIAKFLARSGVASRRECEKLIAEGRIKLNGTVLDTPAIKVTDKDTILFDNKPIAAKEPPRLWRYHKPDGLVTSHNDEQGRKTVFDALPKEIGRVISVGRLDITSEGLLLITNDGGLARALEMPSTGWIRRYRARAWGKVTQYELDGLQKGIVIDGIPTGPIEAELDRQKGDNAWITVTIREGKNREVRRALDSLGLKVNRLIRTHYGPFQLGPLGVGEIDEVKNRILRDQVGHLVDIPEHIPRVPGTRVDKPRRGTHASAKKFAKDSKPEPQGRGRFAKPAKEKPEPKGRGKFAKPAKAKPEPKGRGKFAKPGATIPGSKDKGKFARPGKGKPIDKGRGKSSKGRGG